MLLWGGADPSVIRRNLCLLAADTSSANRPVNMCYPYLYTATSHQHNIFDTLDNTATFNFNYLHKMYIMNYFHVVKLIDATGYFKYLILMTLTKIFAYISKYKLHNNVVYWYIKFYIHICLKYVNKTDSKFTIRYHQVYEADCTNKSYYHYRRRYLVKSLWNI